MHYFVCFQIIQVSFIFSQFIFSLQCFPKGYMFIYLLIQKSDRNNKFIKKKLLLHNCTYNYWWKKENTFVFLNKFNKNVFIKKSLMCAKVWSESWIKESIRVGLGMLVCDFGVWSSLNLRLLLMSISIG